MDSFRDELLRQIKQRKQRSMPFEAIDPRHDPTVKVFEMTRSVTPDDRQIFQNSLSVGKSVAVELFTHNFKKSAPPAALAIMTPDLFTYIYIQSNDQFPFAPPRMLVDTINNPDIVKIYYDVNEQISAFQKIPQIRSIYPALDMKSVCKIYHKDKTALPDVPDRMMPHIYGWTTLPVTGVNDYVDFYGNVPHKWRKGIPSHRHPDYLLSFKYFRSETFGMVASKLTTSFIYLESLIEGDLIKSPNGPTKSSKATCINDFVDLFARAHALTDSARPSTTPRPSSSPHPSTSKSIPIPSDDPLIVYENIYVGKEPTAPSFITFRGLIDDTMKQDLVATACKYDLQMDTTSSSSSSVMSTSSSVRYVGMSKVADWALPAPNTPAGQDLRPFCEYCGTAPPHDIFACPTATAQMERSRKVDKKCWRKDLCRYPLCMTRPTHETRVCPRLNGICKVCKMRGHFGFDCKKIKKESKIRFYEQFRSEGVLTHNDKSTLSQQ